MNSLMNCDVISVRKLENESNLKAFIDIRVAGSLVIRGCTVLNGRNGTFVKMPQKVGRDGQWRDIVIASDDQLKSHYERVILDAYLKEEK